MISPGVELPPRRVFLASERAGVRRSAPTAGGGSVNEVVKSRLARTAESFFESIARRPRTVIAVLAAIAATLAPALLLLRFDNGPDSFLPPEHPALVSKKLIERTFGLE